MYRSAIVIAVNCGSFILTADNSGDVLPPLPQFPHPEQQNDDDLVMGSSEPHNGNHGQDHSDVETSSVEGDSNSC